MMACRPSNLRNAALLKNVCLDEPCHVKINWAVTVQDTMIEEGPLGLTWMTATIVMLMELLVDPMVELGSDTAQPIAGKGLGMESTGLGPPVVAPTSPPSELHLKPRVGGQYGWG